ncbi:hypothetical protein RD136_004619 [Salmonella enterica]|nr:hypothetical protein [Salmonella enterica subsp. enterica serovar Oranienburg]EKY9498846.1 hypothetical protein [Salmonella enterica]
MSGNNKYLDGTINFTLSSGSENIRTREFIGREQANACRRKKSIPRDTGITEQKNLTDIPARFLFFS